MSYQNINQYNFRRLGLLPVNEITDICLASDEKTFDQEVIFSPLLIGDDDGNRMPFKFEFNSTGTTVATVSAVTFDFDTIVSENYWNPDNLDPNFCPSAQTLCDVGLTGIDNGLVKRMSGETIEITTGLYTNISDKFSRYKYDRRMKLHPITGFTTTSNRLWNDDSYTYDLSYDNYGDLVGNFARLNGGFYQGFYKLPGYTYQVFPQRPHWGWTTEVMLRYRWTGDTNVGLNKRYPENKGTFFYMGARAENKFYHYADGHPKQDTGYTRVTSGLTCMHTCECLLTGITAEHSCMKVYQQSGGTSTNCSCGCPCNCETTVKYPELDPLYDGVSNALSLRLSGDTGNPRLCVKTYRITGDCEFTGACLSGLTYVTGVTVNEWCSTRGIFHDCEKTDYTKLEHWVQIDAVFQRNEWFDTCDLFEKGGLGLITETIYTASPAHNSVSLIEPPITHRETYDPATTEIVSFNDNWTEQQKYRLGKFKLYVNGRLFMVVENFEEIIPRLLDTPREKQIGVSYNISIGGGTQGLHDNLTFSGGCPETIDEIVYQQDPECLTTDDLDNTIYSGLTTHIKLEEYFGGSLIGDVSAFRMYVEPLNASQIWHNFKIQKEKYNLLDPKCPDCEVLILPTPTPTITPTNTPSQTQTPSETPTNTPTESPTNTPTPSITASPGQTPTATETNTPTPSITPSETPTNTPSETPTSTPTPTRSRFLFNVCSGDTLLNACECSESGTIWGENENFDENTQFFDSPTGSNTINLTGYYSYNGIVVELDSDGFEIGSFSICPTLTPTPTNTSTETPTPTQTPSITPSPTHTRILFNLCSGTTLIDSCQCVDSGTLWGDYENFDENTQFYDSPTGPVIVNLTGFYSYNNIVVELDSNGFTVGTYSICPTLTPTPTYTPTATETPTQTPSETPTETPTQTPTQSETPTETPTQTPTQTPSETPTQTPTQTETQTQTPSQTPTLTPTETITPTPSETPTQTPTETPTSTPTVTPSITATQTETPTNTPSETPTNTPTSSPTASIGLTPTATETVTPTMTETPTETPTQTVTPSPTSSETPTPTTTTTLTSTPTETLTPTPTNTITQTPTNTPTETETQTPTPSVTPTLTPSNTPSETPTNTPTESETPTPTPSVTPTLTPSNTPTETETQTPTPSVTSTITPSNTPSETPTTTPTPTFEIACDVEITILPTPTPTQTPTETPTNTPTTTQTPTNTPSITPSPTQAIVPSDTTLEIWFQGQTSDQFNPGSITSGDTFTQWEDSSAVAHNANPIGGGPGPAPEWWSNQQNGLGGVYFNGTSDGLSVNPETALASKSGQTVIIVARTLNSSNTAQYIQGGEDANTGLEATYLRQSASTYNIAVGGGFATGGVVNTSSHILSYVFSGTGVTNQDKLKFRIDGSGQTLSYITNIGTTTNALLNFVFMGVSYTLVPTGTTQFFYNWFLFDVLVYSRALTTSELSAVESYLSNKWNIPLL